MDFFLGVQLHFTIDQKEKTFCEKGIEIDFCIGYNKTNPASEKVPQEQ